MAFGKILILTLFMSFVIFGSVHASAINKRDITSQYHNELIGKWYIVGVIDPVPLNPYVKCVRLDVTKMDNNRLNIAFSQSGDNETSAVAHIINNIIQIDLSDYPGMAMNFNILDYEEKNQIVLKHDSSIFTFILSRSTDVPKDLIKKYKILAIQNKAVYSAVDNNSSC